MLPSYNEQSDKSPTFGRDDPRPGVRFSAPPRSWPRRTANGRSPFPRESPLHRLRSMSSAARCRPHVGPDNGFRRPPRHVPPAGGGNGTWGDGHGGGSGEEDPAPLLTGAVTRGTVWSPRTEPPAVTNPRTPANELAGGLRSAENRGRAVATGSAEPNSGSQSPGRFPQTRICSKARNAVGADCLTENLPAKATYSRRSACRMSVTFRSIEASASFSVPTIRTDMLQIPASLPM